MNLIKNICYLLLVGSLVFSSLYSKKSKGKKKKVTRVVTPVEGKVNSPYYHESTPSVTADEKSLYYLMQNPNRAGVRERDDWDIYVATNINGIWTGGRPIRALNTEFYEGYPSISADGRTLFFSSDAYSQNKYKDKDLFSSYFQNGKWSVPENMGKTINIEGLDELGGSVSPNGQTFVFFARNRDDSKGKTDIYISQKQNDGSWGHAVNIGKPINSKYKEFAPFLASDGRSLYFSSDRKGGFGGMDLFKSVLKGKKWSKPVNLGKAINTKGDDLGISIPAEGNKFFTSIRKKNGILDIYSGILPKKMRPYKVILVKGKVAGKLQKNPLECDILIEDLESGKRIGNYKTNTDDGTFVVSLMEGTRYSFTVQTPGYFLYSENYNFKKIGKYREESLSIDMVPIKSGEKALIKNIFFASGSAKLDKKSRLVLKRMVKMLKTNKEIKLEVQGHTDKGRGGKAKNLILSKKRANGVVKYLVSKGISKNRLTAKGYGNSQPLVESKDTAISKKNRRIEFLVLQK